MIPPVVWIPAGFALGLALALYGGMSLAYDRGRRHQREEAEADRAARVFRQLPGVPAHVPPERRMHPVYRQERLEYAAGVTRPDLHPSGPMRQLEPLPADMSDSGFTRSMRDEVARGMAMVERILAGGEP